MSELMIIPKNKLWLLMCFNFIAWTRCIWLCRTIRCIQFRLTQMVHNASTKCISKHIHNRSYAISEMLLSLIRWTAKMWLIHTYKIQSTAKINETSSGGNPTVSSTITNVTRPACGIPAAPMLAAVDVMLHWIPHKKTKSKQIIYK